MLPEDQQTELHEIFAKTADEVIADQPDVIEVKDRIEAKLEEVRAK